MIKKIISLLLAINIAFVTAAFGTEASAPTDETALQQQTEVVQYSNNMQKNIIKTYAHTLADNYYYGIEDEELLFSVICSVIDEGKLDINKAIEAMIKALKDEHAEFYTAEEYKAMTEDIAGAFSGIGVTIRDHADGALVLSVIEGGPAYKAGMMAYDHIIGVNGQDVRSMTTAQVRELIVGETGTEVKVKVLRANKEIDITCVRDTVEVSQLETKMLNDKTAYIRLLQFTTNAPEEMEAHVKELRSKSVKNVVLDLRDNPGGDLQAAIDIANVFISAGAIAELRYKDETKNTVLRSKNFNAPNFKMLVLVNEHSASASELLATAIQSRGVGKILGTQTYGKGSMQVLNRAVTGGGFKYTIGEFYSYKGQRINTIGVTPDFVVENEETKVDESQFAKIDLDRVAEGLQGGDMTLALEQRLEALGYLEEADEVFDEATSDAVSRFQAILGYEINGIPGIYEYMYLNDYNYSDLTLVVDKQMDAAIEYFN
jgi:carboxyl-terminal processing protease